jgi:hypothetical protein
VANLVEMLLGTEHTAAEPYCESLNHVLRDINLDGLGSLTSKILILLQSIVDSLLDLLIESLVEVLEKGASTREDYILIELSSGIDRAGLNRNINDLVQRSSPIIVNELRMEEHLWAKETLISNVNLGLYAGDGVLVDVFLEFVRLKNFASAFIEGLLVELLVLLNHILAHIPIAFFDLLGNIHSVLCRDRLSAVSHLLKDELCDVLASEGNVLHTAANDKAVGYWEHVGHTVARIDDCAGQVTLAHHLSVRAGPANLRVKSQGGLHTNEESLDVESFEHDLCHLLSVLRGVQRRLSQDESMFFGFTSQL